MIDIPDVQYAQSGDLAIAYQVFGEGVFDVVLVPGFVSHADLSWEMSATRGIMSRLASFARVITFDKRGTGVSDRSLGFGSVEDRMDDIRAVMDAAGSERAALVGMSEGGPMTLMFAATYPERVTTLALWGTFARLLRSRDYPVGVDVGTAEQFIGYVEEVWGQGIALRSFLGQLPDGPETDRLLARYERSACTPRLAREILRQNIRIDVLSALSSVGAPALAVHRLGDPMVPVAVARDMADRLGARMVELPGDWHISGAPGGEDDALDAIEEFLTGREHKEADADRILKTVVFTDIVDSTQQAAVLGDRRWRAVLDDHDLATRREIDRFGGLEINTTGDGFLAAFDGPARAIRCATAIAVSARPLGIDVRAGVHTGECEARGDDLAGMTVHIGARVESLAGPGEVLVTSTVRDLVVGSGLEFEDRGIHELKGVPGKWNLLAVQA